MSEPQTFDYIIIGAGTAGALLTNRLSANMRRRVLLIEAGRRDDYHWIHVPVGYLYCMGNPRTDWCYRTEVEPGLNGRSLAYPRGKVLGGSSSINGMIYMRGQARDYDHWAEVTGEPAWSWQNALPDFMRHEDHYRGANEWHGEQTQTQREQRGKRQRAQSEGLSYEQTLAHRHAGGEWRIEQQRLHWPLLDSVALAAQQAGIPATDDFNRGNNEGVGYFEVNQREGWRWNTAKAFLRPTCYGRPNVELWNGAQVTRLLLDESEANDGSAPRRCIGAEVWTGHELVTVHASREMILCAGAIGSPAILQRSGIGPAALLNAQQIPVVVDLPAVGANLQDHLQLRSVYRVRGARTMNTLSHSFFGKARMAMQFALQRRGPLSMAPSQLGIFTRSDSTQPHANLQYHVQPLSLDAFGEPLHQFDALTASVCNLNPTSRGSVQIKSPRFEEAPAIAPNYLSTDIDRKVAIDALRLTRRLMQQPALTKHQPEEIKPGVTAQTDAELSQAASEIGTTIFHPAGTVRMGHADDITAALDSKLRLRGVRGLRVVDASVMPTLTSGNPNSPVLMIAEKAARWIAEANET